jgi:hypothetical protein
LKNLKTGWTQTLKFLAQPVFEKIEKYKFEKSENIKSEKSFRSFQKNEFKLHFRILMKSIQNIKMGTVCSQTNNTIIPSAIPPVTPVIFTAPVLATQLVELVVKAKAVGPGKFIKVTTFVKTQLLISFTPMV